MQHLRWEKSGRTFSHADEGKPNQFTYKSSLGQENVDLGNGQYAPYVWDQANKIVKFADCELRLTSSGLEFWRQGERLNTLAFHPECKEGAQFVRKTPSVHSLAVEAIDPGNSKCELKLSYKLTTEDSETEVSVRAGYNHKVHFGTKFKALKGGAEQRVAIEFLEKFEPVENRDRHGNLLPTTRLRSSKSWWAWNVDERNEHKIEQAEVTKVYLGEKVYELNEEKVISPDTWGPTPVAQDSDDGASYSEGNQGTHWFNTYPPVYGGEYDRHYIGYYSEETSYKRFQPGWRFQNITCSGTAEDGCKITIRTFDDSTGLSNFNSSNCTLKGEDAANPGTFSNSHQPATGMTFTNASVGFSANIANYTTQDSPEIKTIIQELMDKYTYTGSQAMCFAWLCSISSGSQWRDVQDYATPGEYEPELTIVYTPAGVSLSQSAYCFYNDDGDEDESTPRANENTGITYPRQQNIRIRLQVNATGDPASGAYELQYRYKPPSGSFGPWRRVES